MSVQLKESLAQFSEKFGFLLGAGVPLVVSLETILAETTEIRMEEVLRQVLARIGEGVRFCDALADFPDVFSPSYLGMVRAAEGQGTLDAMMGRIARGVREGLIPLGGVAVAADDPTRLEAREAVTRLLESAVTRGASDLHLVPTSTGLSAAARIDGRLVGLADYPESLRDAITTRVKYLAHLDLAERWLTQDGRMVMTVAGRKIDARVNCLPVALGEKITVCLLSQDSFRHTTDQLFADPADRQAFLDLLAVPGGLLVIAGPSGSGKTSTAYGAISTLRDQGRAVTAIEFPVGMVVDGIAQTPVRPHLGMGFAELLNAADRTDCDVLFVGEIPDEAVMKKVIRFALAGRLVVVTLHATGVTDACRRLLDLGAPPHLLASAIVGVIAQRLVRGVCPHCGRAAKLARGDLAALGLRAASVRAREGAGCEHCYRSGYRGRTALYEFFTAGRDFKDCLAQGDRERIAAFLAADPRRTLFAAGAYLVANGRTTLAELQRVLRDCDSQ